MRRSFLTLETGMIKYNVFSLTIEPKSYYVSSCLTTSVELCTRQKNKFAHLFISHSVYDMINLLCKTTCMANHNVVYI